MRLNGDLLVDDDITADTVQANSLGSTPLNASNLTSGTVPPERLPPAIPVPPNIARTDQANTFTVEQNITGGTGTSFDTAPLEIQTVNTPRVSFHWPGVVASQIGMDSTGVIRTYDNPGTGYAPLAASKIVTNATGNNLADLTLNGATNFTAGVTVTGGNVTCGGSTVAATISSAAGLHAGGNIHNFGGFVYPGQAGSGAFQGSWYLGSHSSFGLYTNTGFYAEGVINGQVLTSRAGVYERGRGPAMGDWTAGGVSGFGFATPTSWDHAYMMVGNTVWLAVNIYQGSFGATQLVMILYHAWTAARRTSVGGGEFSVAGYGGFPITITVQANSNAIEVRRADGISIPAGQMYLMFCVPIAL